MILGLTDIINFIAMFQLVVFIFFLFRKKTNRQSNRILAFFLFVQLLIIYDYESFNLKNYLVRISPYFFFIGTSFIFLAAPTFYHYVKSLAFTDFRVQKKNILHAVPFLFSALLFVFYYHIRPYEAKQAIILRGGFLNREFWIFYNGIVLSQILIYFVIDLRILKNYRRQIRQQYSSVNKINLSWLSFILYAFILAWISSVIVFLSENYFWYYLEPLVFLNFFAFFLFFNYIFFKGLTHPEIFSGIEEKPKYISSKLTQQDAEYFLSKLNTYMEDIKPYLNPDITLKELSTELSIPARYLSQVINEYMQLNFYDYISKYRIEEAKRLLSDDSDKTVLEILYEVGFNSKSSFNTAFKKYTGTTPSKFKKETVIL